MFIEPFNEVAGAVSGFLVPLFLFGAAIYLINVLGDVIQSLRRKINGEAEADAAQWQTMYHELSGQYAHRPLTREEYTALDKKDKEENK